MQEGKSECEWMHNSDGVWTSDCGATWEFIDGGPTENNMNYCHKCGRVLRIDWSQDDIYN